MTATASSCLSAIAALGLLAACGSSPAAPTTTAARDAARCDVGRGEARDIRRLSHRVDPSAPELPDNYALAPYPAGTVLCVETVDGGRFATLRVLDQPPESNEEVLVGPETAREIGLMDRGAVRARLSVLEEPPASRR